MEDETNELVRSALRDALTASVDDVGTVLAEFDWQALFHADGALAFTVLFEQLGYLAISTDALDIATAVVLGIDGHPLVLWPLTSEASGQELGGSGVVSVAGLALHGGLDAAATVLVPMDGSARLLAVSSLQEAALGGMATGSGWHRARFWGALVGDFGPWSELERHAMLAVASELVGVTRRIIDVAAAQVTTRHQFGRSIASNQSVRFRLAEAHVDMVGARALVAAAWEDGSPESAMWAKAVAGSAHDTVAKHAMQVCGAIGLSEEHPLPALVRRGYALDALLGAAVPQTARIGTEFVTHQRAGSSASACSAVGWF